MSWIQVYDPLGAPWLSTAAAAVLSHGDARGSYTCIHDMRADDNAK